MELEIERKFRLEALPDGFDSRDGERIEQGYLALDPQVEVRVRRRAGVSSLTVKRGRGKVREEVELPLTNDQFESLWQLTKGRRVAKTRCLVPGEHGLYEVDIFEGPLAGLLIVEIEFDSPEASERFRAPAWLGAEVTGDQRFENRSLAEGSLPD